MNTTRKALGIAAVFTSLLFIALGQGSIASTDDALYAQMAWEMAQSGQWLRASWLGVEVFEKPPLLLWMLRVSGGLFGWSEFALRLPGVIGAAFTFYFMARLVHAESSSWLSAMLALLITIATVTFTLNTRRPMTDPLLCAAVMGTLWYTLCLITLPRRSALFGLGLTLGLGVLAKWVAMGPVALVAALALLKAERRSEFLKAIGIAFLIAFPWFGVMTWHHGGVFWEVFLGYHVVARAGEALVGSEGLSFYADTLWQLDGVFGVLVISGLLSAMVLRRGTLSWIVCATGLLTLAVIHLSSTRLYHYLMPVIPLGALALALSVARSRLASATLACAAFAAFLVGPLDPTLTRPNFAPESKRLGLSLAALPEEATIITWEDYDPALIWYAKRPIRIWTQSETMAAVQNSIDMMRRAEAVVLATPERLAALAESDELIVIAAPRQRAQGLLQWVQGLTHRAVGVDAESMPGHVVVRLRSRS